VASKDELSEQLAITQKLASTIDMMAKSMSRVEASYDTQIAATQKLIQVMDQLKDVDLSQLNNTKLDALQKEFKDTEKQSITLTGKLKDLGQWMANKFPVAGATAIGAIDGFSQGLSNLFSLGKGVTGFFGSLVDGLVNVAASIISIPFKMFDGLVGLAQNAGGMNELAEALRKMRMEFGHLTGPTNKAIIETSKSLTGFSDTGLSAWHVFGNLAQRMEYMVEIAKGMGATFNKFTKEFEANGGALLAYQKGLGISAEQMQGFGQLATATGSKLSDVLKDTTKYTLELGNAFKLDAKLISKDMAKALMDVKHFAGATVKQIAEASTYARKLGIELEKITGTLDAFETFDSAAENAAKLSQSFGVTVDAFKLMEAQDPASQVDMLRKSLLAAGKSADQMSRQELKLLAQTTGLDEATAKMAFSAKNQGLSLDEVKKKGAEAEKKTLTQAAAMGKLADAIERLVLSGSGPGGGFFDHFIHGFLGGIQASKEFREIMMNIRWALMQVTMEGVKLGRAFVQLFPGMQDFLQGIADFFQPAKFKSLASGVSDVFTDFFKKLTSGVYSFPELMKQLQKKFFDFFDREAPAGKKVLDGFKTIFKTITKIVAEGIKWVSDQIGSGIKFITDMILHPEKLKQAASGGSGALGFLAGVLEPLVGALKHAWVTIAPALLELVRTLGKKLYGYLTSSEFIDMVKPAIPVIAAIIFGPTLGRAMLSTLTATIAKSALGALTGGGKKAIEQAAMSAAEKVLAASKTVASKGADTKGLDQISAANKASGEAVDKGGKGDKWGAQDAVKLGLKLIAMATALAVGGVMMAGAIVVMKKTLDAGGIKGINDVVAPLTVLGAMVVAAVPLALALKIAAKAGSMKDVLVGGLIISTAVGIVGGVGALLAFAMSKAGTPAELESAGNLMLKMSVVFLAMVPLIFASMAIGALASGPQAIALGAAAVGLGVIGVAVGQMAIIAMGIVEALAKLKIDAGFQVKIDAFLGIMKSIQSFADTMVTLVGLMAPSFAEMLTGKVTTFPEKVNKTVELIREMIGRKGSGVGIIGLVELVVEKIKELNISGPGLAESANIFSSVLHAVTEVMKAMTPPPEYFSAQTDFINILDPAVGRSLGQTMKAYMTVMMDNVRDVSAQIKEMVKSLPSLIRPEDVGRAKAIAELISALASAASILTPDAKTLELMKDTSERSNVAGLVLSEKKTTGATSEKIATFIKEKSEALQKIIGAITTGPLQSVLEAVKTIPESKLNGIKIVSDVMRMIIDLVSAINSGVPKGELKNIAVGDNSVLNLVPDITRTLNGLKETIQPLILTFANVIKGLPTDDAKLMGNINVAKSMFGFIGEVAKLFGSIKEMPGGNVTQAPIDAINAARVFMGRLVNDDGFNPLGRLMSYVGLVSQTLSGGVGTAGITNTFTTLKTILGLINSASNDYSKMAISVAEASKSIGTKGAGGALDAIEKMVSTIIDLNSALEGLPKIDINTKLGAVAKAAGLGAKGNWTIKNKDIVLNVNFHVTMNVDEVEKVMILRKESFLRDRINIALDGVGAKEGSLPETRESPVQVPFNRGTR
jgi:hypothetical protein